jgi:Universal stress protein family
VARGRIRILVGVDFSPESLGALRAARALAAKTAGRVTLTHVRPTSNLRAAIVEDRGDLLRGKPGRLSATRTGSDGCGFAVRTRKCSCCAASRLRLSAARRAAAMTCSFWEIGDEAASPPSCSAARSRRRSPDRPFRSWWPASDSGGLSLFADRSWIALHAAVSPGRWRRSLKSSNQRMLAAPAATPRSASAGRTCPN